MPVPLQGNMRAGNTARVGAARVGGFRVGAVFKDIRTSPSSGSEYVWDMNHGVKPLDSDSANLGPLNEDGWTSSQR